MINIKSKFQSAFIASVLLGGCISSDAADGLGRTLGEAFAAAIGEVLEPVFDASVASDSGETLFVACEDDQGCISYPYAAAAEPLHGSILSSVPFDGARLGEGGVLSELVVGEVELLEGEEEGSDVWRARTSFVVLSGGTSSLEILRDGDVIDTIALDTEGDSI